MAQVHARPAEHQKVLPFKTRSSRRSSHACLSCRVRKVRCDVVERHPCGNCKWAKCDCVITQRGSNRRILLGHKRVQENVQQPPFIAETLSLPVAEPESDNRPSQLSKESPRMMAYLDSPPQRRSSPEIHPNIQLERFIKPIPTKIPYEDIAHFVSKGSLTLPCVNLQNALIRSYFEYTHPYIPIIDIKHFTQIVGSRDGGHGQISLLLYQAVMFAGTAHVPMKCLERNGFRSRKQARKELFQRVRVLFDSNFESDDITIVQTAILMTLYYDSTEGHRNAWHWKEVAISQAFAARLHLKPENLGLSREACRLRRKIWWSCYLRDRVVSVMTNRPPRIRGDDFQVPLLDDEDFETSWLNGAYNNLSEELCPYFYDKQKHEELGQLFIALVRLCRHLDPYLMTHLSPSSVGIQTIAYNLNSSRQCDGCADAQVPFASLRQDLKAWQNSLPECCQFESSSDLAKSAKSRILVQRVSLHLFYQSMLLAIHQSRSCSLARRSMAPWTQESSRHFIHDAAFEISWVASKIHQIGYDQLIPTSALIAVIPAAAVHMQSIKGRVEMDKGQAYLGLRQCLEVLDTIQDDYEPAMLAKNAIDMEFNRLPNHSTREEIRDEGKGEIVAATESPDRSDGICRNEDNEGTLVSLDMNMEDTPSPGIFQLDWFNGESDLAANSDREDFANPQLLEFLHNDAWFECGMEGLSSIPELLETLLA